VVSKIRMMRVMALSSILQAGLCQRAAQNETPTRPRVKKTPQAWPLGYAEDVFEPRTKLEAVFQRPHK